VCETFGEDILLDKKCAGAKKARELARTSKQKVGGGLNKASSGAKDVAVAAKKTVDPMAKFIEKTFADIKKADTEGRRNIIIKGGVVPKISRWLKRVIPTLAVGAAVGHPIIVAAISLLTYVATDKHFDRKEKAKILNELRSEDE
jgi:hypothetical protein